MRNTVVLSSLVIVAIACQPQAPPAPPAPDYAAEHGPLADAFINAWNTGNLDQLDNVMAADFQRTAPGSGPGNADGLAAMKDVMTGFRAGWPDTNVVFDESFFLEDASIHRWTFNGTNTGEGDSPPTGKAAEVSGVPLRFDFVIVFTVQFAFELPSMSA